MTEATGPATADIGTAKGAGLISVVVPVFNEQESLDELRGRLTRVLEGMGRLFEIIFVDDGSADLSLEKLVLFAREDARIRVIEFNRNYGQHAAVLAGFEEARGDVMVTLDADLQNPPEEIPKLIARIDEGFEVVGGNRLHRRDSYFRRLASGLINRLLSRSTGIRLTDSGCMLRAYRREIVQAILRCKEISTFVPVLAAMFAKRVTDIDVDHCARLSGRSKYGLLRLIKLQFDLTTAFSLWPLRMVTAFGFLLALGGLAASVTLISLRFLMGDEYALEGVFTLFSVLFLFVGLQFMALGVLGEYIGRIYSEVRGRPRYVIRKVYGGPQP